MSTQVALSKNHPFMVAWEKYVSTPEYANSLKWALAETYDDGRPISPDNRKTHAEGAIWLAFTKGLELAASPAQPEKRDEWVSVENEMPKDFLGVIVAHYPFKELVVWVAMRVNGFWVQCHNPEMEFCTHKVTHWQPLPAPPQSGKEEERG